jgi:uncharacterized protein with FMN-binding domain
MRRAVLTLGGTVAGLAALFSFKTHVPGIAAASTPTELSATSPTVTSSAATSPTLKPPAAKPTAAKPTATKSPKAKPTARKSPTVTAPATTTPPTVAPATKAPASTAPSKTQASKAPPSTSPPKAPKTTAPAAPSGTFSGPTVNTQYGPVKVTITVTDGKITSASDPDGGDNTAVNAAYQLDQEVVSAQSASIQAVSGATYTSDGYIQSLQSAVDAAHL